MYSLHLVGLSTKMASLTIPLTTILISSIFGVLGASLSNSVRYQAPDECQWFGSTDADITLVCRLRTINSELENTNFSVIQPQNTIRLRLECNDSLFFHSSISPGNFRSLIELRSLTINYCKIANLTAGAFNGLRELRNLTIVTHNTYWSSMSLDIASNVFNGKTISNLHNIIMLIQFRYIIFVSYSLIFTDRLSILPN